MNEKCANFLAIAPQFSLGALPTEQPHPATSGLSSLANHDQIRAYEVLKRVDEEALASVFDNMSAIEILAGEMQRTLSSGGRIFFCGCGATGRLSLTLEFLWKTSFPERRESVLSFMAGGDVALIRSIEDFEDAPEFGKRQLEELGFSKNDLLVASTEGGETPFVIGATEAAVEISKRKPWFLYCNPSEILISHVARSRRVIENSKICALALACGPMALSGSTRMQASTVLLLAAGAALFHSPGGTSARDIIIETQQVLKELSYGDLIPLTEAEASLYSRGEFLLYQASPALAITVATDTTERAPTFSLAPFENVGDSPPLPSLSHLLLHEAANSKTAWELLLARSPRALTWERYYERVSEARLYGYDFSRKVIDRRKSITSKEHHLFFISDEQSAFTLMLGNRSVRVSLRTEASLIKHLALKVLLNAHSTLVMGKLGRYESNIMTYVRPANNKLIDRAIRYARLLLSQQGIEASYEKAAQACFEEMEHAEVTDPIVLKVCRRLQSQA